MICFPFHDQVISCISACFMWALTLCKLRSAKIIFIMMITFVYFNIKTIFCMFSYINNQNGTWPKQEHSPTPNNKLVYEP